MRMKNCVCWLVTRLLLDLVQVTSCPEQILPRITLITDQNLEISHWRDDLDVDIVPLPKGNLSFYDVVEATEKVFRAVHGGKDATRAIIGSGNTIIDGLIARNIGLISKSSVTAPPFISIKKHDNYQLHLSFVPSPTDRNHIVTDLAVELGCQHITVFTRRCLTSADLQQLQITAHTHHSISLKIVELSPDDTPLPVINLADHIYQMRNFSSVLVVLDCPENEAKYLIDASKMTFVKTVEFHWLVLEEVDHVDYKLELLPPGVLGTRSRFDERNWVYDALTLLNRSFRGCVEKHIDENGCTDSKETSSLHLYRQMLTQKFSGKTGWVQFNAEGNRVGASFDIIKTSVANFSSNGTQSWVTVGYTEAFKVNLDKSFWTDFEHNQANVVRVVMIEEEPMLIVSKGNVARDEDCVLSYPCTRHVQYDNRSERTQPVKCCCTGFLIDILQWLVKDLSFQVELYLVADGKFGSYDPVSKQWDGIMADLLSNKTEMALTTLTTTSIRAKFVDFSYPFFYGETKILVSFDSDLKHGTLCFLAPFDVLLWIVFLASISAVLGIVWALEKCSPFGHRNKFYSRNDRFSLTACMSYIWSNVVKLELEGMKPQSSSARFTTAVFSFCTLIIMTSYTANLAASLVQKKEELPVTGIEDPKFQDPPSGFTFTTLHSSGTLSLFTNSHDVAYRRIGRNMIPHLVKNYTEGLDKLKNGELDAFIYDSPFIDLGASKMPGCSFKVVGTPIITKAYAVGFPKESKWRDPVTNLLLKYQRKDYFRKLQDKWFQGSCLHTKGSPKSAYKMKPRYLRGLVLICCGAVSTCFVILFGEYLWSRKKKKQGKYKTSRRAQGNVIQLKF